LFEILLLSCGVVCTLLVVGYDAGYTEQEQSDPFVVWAKKCAIPITTVEFGNGLADLQPLKPVIGKARVVALGESAHGMHEFLAFRNRLLEFLVQEMGFTAIAVETGFAEAIQVDDYIMGGVADSSTVAQSVFMWSPQAYRENQELIEWIRRHNANASTARNIRFYGVDLTGGQNGVFINSRRALGTALSYIEQVDSSLAQQFRFRLEPLLEKFNDKGYPTLASDERKILTAVISDLVSVYERQRATFLAQTSESDYHKAYRHAVVARQLDAYFQLAPDTTAIVSRVNIRDAAMADNFRWVLEREGPQGRVLVFAHNWHIKKSPSHKESYAEFFPRRLPTMMGQHLRSMLGNDMVVLGFTFNQGLSTAADSSSIDGTLARIRNPLFVLNLRAAPTYGAVAEWLNRERRMRVNDRYGELNLIKSFDALVFVEKITEAHAIR
jgi:erythromycin esterase